MLVIVCPLLGAFLLRRQKIRRSTPALPFSWAASLLAGVFRRCRRDCACLWPPACYPGIRIKTVLAAAMELCASSA